MNHVKIRILGLNLGWYYQGDEKYHCPYRAGIRLVRCVLGYSVGDSEEA